MKEIVIISGKGGTGKTSLTSSFAALANHAVLADCDVDAADLHLILNPDITASHEFFSGNEAVINQELCIGCGMCMEMCKFDAIRKSSSNKYSVDPTSCEGCGVCVEFCPPAVVDFPTRRCGEWYQSETRFGPMVHAKLGIAAENSGKLVSTVRQEARRVAQDIQAEFILIDGPPGVGCPVIASITGADAVVIVTEPTLSGLHDLKRTVALAQHFSIPAFICVNKYDINLENTQEIETYSTESGAILLGKILYSKEVTKAQILRQSIVEYGSPKLKQTVSDMWQKLCHSLNKI